MAFLATLRTEVQRRQNRHFLEAAMAVCALSALSGARVSLAERYQVDTLIATLDRLSIYDPHEAVGILDEFIFQVRDDPAAARHLITKIRRYAKDKLAALALLRMAYLVMTADGAIGAKEQAMFGELCAVLNADSAAVLATLTEKQDQAAPAAR